jgi:hypothetical protein
MRGSTARGEGVVMDDLQIRFSEAQEKGGGKLLWKTCRLRPGA